MAGQSGIQLAALLFCVGNLGLVPAIANDQTTAFSRSDTVININQEYIMTASADDERPTRSSSRIAAPEVAPVIHSGIRYEQLKAPSSEGLPPGGYVVVTEIATGNRLNVIKVYDIAIDPNKESDVQIVFFKSMALNKQGDALRIEDEKRRLYSVDLKSGEVQVQPEEQSSSFFQKLLSNLGIGK